MVRARGAKCRSLLTASLAGCVALAAAAPAAAAPAAAQEYVLTPPGVDKTSITDADLQADGPTSGDGGVVGEHERSETTVAVIGSALLSPAGAAIIAPALALIGFALVRRRRGPGAHQRPGAAG